MRNRRNIILLIEVLLFIFLIYTSYKIYSYYKDLKVDDGKRRQHYIIVHSGIHKTMINNGPMSRFSTI